MGTNTSGLRRGGPGRPKGAKNKRVKEFLEVWREFLDSDQYLDAGKKRLLQGKAPHLETYLLNKLHGKPIEQHEHSGPNGEPIPFTWLPPT